jgi:hypothetical protein
MKTPGDFRNTEAEIPSAPSQPDDFSKEILQFHCVFPLN